MTLPAAAAIVFVVSVLALEKMGVPYWTAWAASFVVVLTGLKGYYEYSARR